MRTDLLLVLWQDFPEWVNQAIRQMGEPFQAYGLTLFRAIAVCLVGAYGVRTMLEGDDDSLAIAGLVRLLLLLAGVYLLLAYYSTPIPGIGYSTIDLVLEQAEALAARLHQREYVVLWQALGRLEQAIQPPASVFDVLGAFAFWIMIGILWVARVTIFVIIAFGFVASGVAVVLGPLFIPLALVPVLNRLFYSWLFFFIQYAFYQVVAEAYLYIWAYFTTHAMATLGGELWQQVMPGSSPLTLATTTAWSVRAQMLILMVLTFTIGAWWLPKLVSNLFSGTSGLGPNVFASAGRGALWVRRIGLTSGRGR